MNRLAALPPVGWWLVPLGVAVAFIGWETDWGRALTPIPEPAEVVTPKPVPVSVLPDFTVAGGLAARRETIARTLFNPTRRPAPPVVAEAPKPTIKRGQFTLTGTLVVDGKSTAFLREVAGGKARRVLQGESINGLTVAEVKPDRVRLTLGDESEDLMLKVQTNPKPTTAVAAAPPAGTAGGSQPAAAGSAPPVVAGTAATARPDTAPQPGESRASLIERRRAAREAAAAAANQAAAVAPAPSPAASGAPRVDPDSWAAVEQRYRDRSAQRP
jgi:hypothetical protein